MDRLKIKCRFCGKEVLTPKEYKGEVVQKFCSKKCRFAWHNRRKLEPFTKDLMALLERFGYGGGKDG
ncbi:MAG: hypothetical protein COZ69_08765 [Deltaproteobacteria bacterium CG_4_8_14_3_um_filter_45_9]|nr:MAG: hypothetical protein COZ69_08765 [Deltaproteobacteria bacterium CG_4_8_14_3_um_filter_45_9]